MNKTQKTLLAVTMVLGAAIIVVFSGRYMSARKELTALKSDLAASTATWKQINEEKLVVQKELKTVKNELRDVELTISESEERAAALEAEIETLEKEILALKDKLPAAE